MSIFPITVGAIRTGRWLKDKYPCRSCGIPVDVRRRSDIKFAMCVRCCERDRHFRLAAYRLRAARETFEAFRGAAEERRVPKLIEAAAMAMDGAAEVLKACEFQDNGQTRAAWFRIARGWVEWSREVSLKVEAQLTELGRGKLEKIDGELPVDAPAEDGPRGVLRLVAPPTEG